MGMTRAPISALLALVLTTGMAATAAAQGKATYLPVKRTAHAEQRISPAEVHITPTTMQAGGSSIDISGDHWSARGYSLKDLISLVYDTDIKRIDLAANGSPDARYDVALSSPQEMDPSAMQQMLVDALQIKFDVRITPETRAMEVYVISAPAGPGSQLHRHGGGSADDDEGQVTTMGRDCPGISSHGMQVSATSISDFGRVLEMDLDRAVVDETRLPGSYDFKIDQYSSREELLKQLRDQLGLVVRPLERQVTVLKVRPQDEFATL
jgi:uncharacterized protein (TIGR03435 family)